MHITGFYCNRTDGLNHSVRVGRVDPCIQRRMLIISASGCSDSRGCSGMGSGSREAPTNGHNSLKKLNIDLLSTSVIYAGRLIIMSNTHHALMHVDLRWAEASRYPNTSGFRARGGAPIISEPGGLHPSKGWQGRTAASSFMPHTRVTSCLLPYPRGNGRASSLALTLLARAVCR